MSVLSKIYKNRPSNFEDETTSLKYGYDENLESDSYCRPRRKRKIRKAVSLKLNPTTSVVNKYDENLESENVRGKKRKKRKIDFKRIGAAVLSGGASELARKAKKDLQRLKKSGKLAKLKGRLRGKAKQAFLYAKYASLTPVFAPILPFKIPMLIMLKKRGIKVNPLEPIAMVAEKFYKNVLKNQPNFDLETYQENIEFLDNPDNFTGEQNHFYDQIVKIAFSIIKGIVEFFKKKKAEKDSGAKLPSDESAAIAAAEKVSAATEGKSESEIKAIVREPETAQEIKTAIDKADKSGTVDPDKKDEATAEGTRPMKGKKNMLLIGGALALVLVVVLMRKK